MQKRILTISVAIAAILLLIGLFPVHGEEEIYQSVVRLHVLANSDSEEDQALKLRVRDRVLTVTTPLLEGVTERSDAVAVLEDHLDEIRSEAEDCLREAGCDDNVSVLLGKETYPEREYDSFCFPSGEYLSLRVVIGDGAGHNWWCCLFPQLCVGSSTVPKDEAEESFVEVGLTPDQYKVITETEKPVYKVRFKILEILNSIFR